MNDRQVLISNCEQTMELDVKAIGTACGTEAPILHTNLCRSQLNLYDAALKKGEPLLVTCTQEMPLFSEIAADMGEAASVSFVNIREHAGWCETSENPTAKIAALLKASTYQSTATRLKSIISEGLCLVYGRGQPALSAAIKLSEHLSVTLILEDADDIILPTVLDIPIFGGKVSSASGSFGSFDIIVDHYAAMLPSSRGAMNFTLSRDDVATNFSVILDLSGGAPLFSGSHHRDGYKHIDAKDTAAISQAILDLSGMVGEFEKPIYVDYNQEICAHSRSKKTGCNKCLDVCPAGAINDDGDYIAVDAGICGGCGSCHAVCPTGAVNYSFPNQSDLIGRAQLLVKSYLDAGGENPVLLVHDFTFGNDLIGVIARYGKGLPANVIPFAVHATTIFGHVEMAACLTAGAVKIQILNAPQRQDELSGLQTEIDLCNTIMTGFGFGEQSRIELIVEADPDIVETRLRNTFKTATGKTATGKTVTGLSEVFSAVGTKREIARTIFNKLNDKSDRIIEIFPLPQNAPYGFVDINKEACTLCMACVSICPADAMRDTPDKPQLRLVESACVQCGLCVNTCPESALTLSPRLNPSTTALQPITLKEEEPFKCIECGTPFATKSTIDRISKQLAGKHSMFQDADRARLIKMCADCRVVSQANSKNDPFAAGKRPRIRTTDDYLNAEKKGLSVDDFLIDE
ncbi:MAG: 4Fe-4S binding protein [Sneathiella sp.]|nr:4Fe-4S binding protein [Sneathiella sp.]